MGAQGTAAVKRSGRGGQRRREAAAGAWSAALPPRRSRKRWKRGWTITATSPALTLLEKLRGKTGAAAADRGSSFLYRKTLVLFHFTSLPPKKIKRSYSHPTPAGPTLERARTETSTQQLRPAASEGHVRRFPAGSAFSPRPAAALQRERPGKLTQPRSSLPWAFTSLFCALLGSKQTWATSRE